MTRDPSIIFFDGVCNFCSYWVNLVIRLDQAGKFHFAPLQSDIAREKLRSIHPEMEKIDSIILYEDKQIYTESTAILHICKGLGKGWRLLYLFIVIPKPIRDIIYRWVARNRYRWFGKQDQCMTPSEDVRKRFLF